MKVRLRVRQLVVELHGLCLCSSSQNHKPVCAHTHAYTRVRTRVCALMLLNWDVGLM